MNEPSAEGCPVDKICTYLLANSMTDRDNIKLVCKAKSLNECVEEFDTSRVKEKNLQLSFYMLRLSMALVFRQSHVEFSLFFFTRIRQFEGLDLSMHY